jgi:hypothetical protein
VLLRQQGNYNNDREMTKIITIGDLHGSPAWKSLRPEEWDRMIFIGDYVDSFVFPDEEIVRNLEEVIDLKKQFPGKVILLWGNHDLCYFYGGHERHYASGFRRKMLPVFYSIYNANRTLFRAAFQVNNYLWTHAGVVRQWYDEYIAGEVRPGDENLAGTLNRLFLEYCLPLYHVSPFRGGMYRNGGIFWADKSEMAHDPLRGYHQVVGHTKTKTVEHLGNIYGEDTDVTWVDCLDFENAFFTLEI